MTAWAITSGALIELVGGRVRLLAERSAEGSTVARLPGEQHGGAPRPALRDSLDSDPAGAGAPPWRNAGAKVNVPTMVQSAETTDQAFGRWLALGNSHLIRTRQRAWSYGVSCHVGGIR